MASNDSNKSKETENRPSELDGAAAEEIPTTEISAESTTAEGSSERKVSMAEIYRVWDISQRVMSQDDPPSSEETEEEKMTRFIEWLVSIGIAESEPISLPLVMPSNQTKVDEEFQSHRFPYQKLETPTSIRLLKLLPLTKTESDIDLRKPIHCSIETVDLDDNPEYDALSYTWGDPLTLYSDPAMILSPESWSKQAWQVICDGKPVSVTTNLYTALLAFRWIASLEGSTDFSSQMAKAHVTKTAYLWVDALCINQNDIAERNEQVAKMGRIYKQAASTYVWLGGEDDCYSSSKLAIDSLCQMDIYLADKFTAADICDKTTYEMAKIPPISVTSWIDLYAFLSRSWFKRAWIVQEVAQARKVVVLCGLKIMTFSSLKMALVVLRRSRWVEQMRLLAEPLIEGHRSSYMNSTRSNHVEEPKRLHSAHYIPFLDHNVLSKISYARAGFGIVDYNSSLKDDARPLMLSTVLNEQRFTEATDPRDKVYAFMGIAQEFVEEQTVAGGLQLLPDYRKSVQEVYSEATLFMIASLKSLKVLSLVQDGSETKLEGLPSWVPDFSAEGWPYAIDDGRPMPWTATDGLGKFQIPVPKHYRLPVVGIKSGTIRGSMLLSLTDPFSMFSFLLHLPGVSKINKPEMSAKLREYLLKTDVDDWLSERPSLPVTEDASGLGTLQTRYEVLWRTLLADCFHGQHPAPAKCGKDLDLFLKRRMNKIQWDSLEHFLQGDNIAWEAAKSKIRSAYTIWQTIKSTSHSMTQNLWPPEYHKAIKALEKTSAQEDPVAVTRILMTLREEMQSLIAGEDDAGTEEVLTKTRHVNARRKLLRTNQGQLGLGPFSMETGDQIWLLVGANVPFVLRPVSEGEYRLIGEAYVHGIMHGEAVSRNPAALDPSEIYLV